MTEQPPVPEPVPEPAAEPTAGPAASRTEPPAHRAPRRLSPLTPVVRSFIVLVAAATTILRDVTRGDLGPTAVAFGSLLVAGAAYGLASWARTTFWIEADELRVDTGVLSRQSRRIRIDRLQGIDIVQPFVARLFGLAELRMDVAGGSAREGSLAYLPLAEARRLKDLLLARRDLARRDRTRSGADRGDPATGDPATGASVPGRADAPPAPPVPERTLARVDLRTLVLSTLLSVDMIVLLLVGLGALVAFAVTGAWVGASAVVPVVGGLGLAQMRRVTSHYRFTVSETAAGLQVRRGLFDLSSQTIALARIQGVVISEPAPWRKLGWARLDVSIAGYSGGGEDQGPAPSTVLPVGPRPVVAYLAAYLLRGLDVDVVPLSPSPRRARWAAPVAARFLAAGTTDRLVVTREGWLTRRTHAAPHPRVQSVRLTQGPWQRRLGLADVYVDSPPGPAAVCARHRLESEARALFEQEVAVGAASRRPTAPARPGTTPAG